MAIFSRKIVFFIGESLTVFCMVNAYNNWALALVLMAIFYINPFMASALAFFLLFYGGKLSSRSLIYVTIIAAFWGLLNFTQKSSGWTNTDIMRYYPHMEFAENESVVNMLNFYNPYELLNFTFYPMSFVVVSMTGRVEMMGFFWVFVVYFLAYLSIYRLFSYYGCNSQRKYAIVILLTTFCFILFVEVGDIMKQASAFAIFFYAYTLYLTKGKLWIVVLLNVLSIGCQPSVLILYLFYFSHHFRTYKVILSSVVLLPLLASVNTISLLFDLMPTFGLFAEIEYRYSGYSEPGRSATVLYIVIAISLLLYSLLSWKEKNTSDKRVDVSTNIALLYLLILFANFNNFVLFKRFTLFAYFPFLLITTINITRNWGNRIRYVTIAVCAVMFLVTLKYTNGRLNGHYSSSYMKNSFSYIVMSPMSAYLSEHY